MRAYFLKSLIYVISVRTALCGWAIQLPLDSLLKFLSVVQIALLAHLISILTFLSVKLLIIFY